MENLYVGVYKINTQDCYEFEKNIFLGQFKDRNAVYKKIKTFCLQEKSKGHSFDCFDFFTRSEDGHAIRHNNHAEQFFK